MANLFSKSAIKHAIASFQGLNIDREITIVQELYDDFRKGNMKDETRYEQNFNELFFHQLLGYDPKTNFHPKASTPVGSKIADVGLGFFAEGLYSYEGVKVVVELKGCETMLDKKQASYGGQSPVDQGFGYKTSFTHCPWLIVSNFASVRLYRDNKQDFEVRTIEELASPDNDYYHLKTLLALLKRSHLISASGTSYTETILSEVRSKQEQITKDFYKQYKTLRLELINDIRQHNTDVSVEVAVEKAQKIIDRIIFIHFCEDRGLLPEGKLKTNLLKGHEVDLTPWEVLKLYFRGVDKGSEKLGIPNGYNGGLFQEDVVLNNLEIGATICHKFIDLGHYNFDDELSVNILGHIFEQSISDIEQLKGELSNTSSSGVERSGIEGSHSGETGEGDLSTSLEMTQMGQTHPALPGQGGNKKESKRKKDGIFYTPEYIVDYIVQNSLMTYLEEKENECLAQIGKKGGYKTEIEAYQAYQHILQQVKVLDPACGSGAFLVRVFDYLYTENKRVGQIIGSLFSTDEIYKSILRDNIYGVDLNPESVEITKLSLWLKSAQKGKKLNNLDANIKCGNSLIDDPAIAGERAFDWQKEFADIIGAGGFDVIVGNPPYVRIQNLDVQSKIYFEKNYQTAYKNYDLYLLFVEKAYQIISSKGKVGYIMPKKFITTDYGEKLKSMLYEKRFLDTFLDFGVTQIFADATTYTGIFIFNKKEKNTFNYQLIGGEENLLNIINFDETNYKNIATTDWILVDKKEKDIFDKLIKNNKLLLDFTEKVFQGLATSADPVYILEKSNQGFYSKITKKTYNFDSELIKPLLRGSDIKKYGDLEANSILIFPYHIDNGTIKLIDQKSFETNHKDIWEYLKSCEDILRGREKGKMDHDQWYGYVYPKSLELFSKEKIITQVLAKHSSLTFDKLSKYFVGGGTAGGYGITLKEDSGLDYKFLLTLLNSRLLEWFLHKYASPFSGGYYAYSRATMEKLPIKKVSLIEQQPFIDKADTMLSLNKELHEKIDFVLRFLQQKYSIEKLSNKLQKFRELDFAHFVKELKVKNMSMSDEAELMRYFDEQKADIVALKSRIDTTDREIDAMVFELYGLSEEEREVVMG